MTHQEILEKAIAKAIKNGWTPLWVDSPYSVTSSLVVESEAGIANQYFNYHLFIFNHSFAKALWGYKPHVWHDGKITAHYKEWIYHLQAMVISEGPIKYLGENL